MWPEWSDDADMVDMHIIDSEKYDTVMTSSLKSFAFPRN